MAYVSGLGGGYGQGASVIANDAPQHAVLVPDAELLFTGAFRRAGPDLVLTGNDGHHHIVPGYFASEQPPALMAPNGASLTGDVVKLLAGSPTPGQYAQAQPTTPADAIGHVEKAVGDATVMRNGVAVALHVGDAVYKSDVLQTGAASSVGISFPDGTALNLVANTRMALNEYSYDPNGNSNAALMTLVEGTFAFVAGKVAHTGDMKIATPVATMGIRGTTGVVEQQQPGTISSNQGQMAYGFAVVPDFGTTANGAYTLCFTDPTSGACQVFTTVSQTGFLTFVTPQGIGLPPTVSIEPLTGAQFAFEQNITAQLFELLSPNLQTNPGSHGSSTPPPFEQPNPNPQQYENNGTPLYVYALPDSPPPGPGTGNNSTGPNGPTAVVIWISGSGNWDGATDWSDGIVPWSISLVEILAPVTVTLSDDQSAGGLFVAAGATLDVVNGGTLEVFYSIGGGGTIELDAAGSDPTLAIAGKVTLKGGGTILMTGTPGDDAITGVAHTEAKLVNVDYTITGAGTIGHDGDGNLTFVNEGTVDATGLLIVDTGNALTNATGGLMEATAGGTLQLDDVVDNSGLLYAAAGGTLDIRTGSIVWQGGTAAAGTNGILVAGTLLVDTADLQLSGGGAVLLTGGDIVGAASSDVFENVDNTISGAGTIENLTLRNDASGVIDADVSGGLLKIDVVAASNAGVMEATGGGELQIITTLSNANVVEAESGGTLLLQGVINNTSSGQVLVGAGSTLILDGATINDGTLTNSGMTEVNQPGTSELQSVTVSNAAGATFEATGLDALLTLSDGSLDNFGTVIATAQGAMSFRAEQFTNEAGATFEATAGGSITYDTGTVTNDGSVVADGGTVTFEGSLEINNNAGAVIEATDNGRIVMFGGDGISLINAGMLEALNGGTISLDQVAVTNDGGTIAALADGTIIIETYGGPGVFGGVIEAVGTGAAVELFAASLNDLTLKTGGGGIIEAASGTSTFLNVTIDDGGVIKIDTGAILNLSGGTSGIALTLDGTVTFEGGGTVTMDFPSYQIVAGVNGAVLDDDTTMQGSGTIGTGNDWLTLNIGALGAVIATGFLTIATGDNIINNAGLLEAIAGATLAIDSGVNNTGTIKADGGTITITDDLNSGVGNTGLIEALDHGSITIIAPEGMPNLLGGIIRADDGTVTLTASVPSGDGSSIQNNGLMQASDGGSIMLTGNGGGVANYGTMDADGGTISIAATALLHHGTGIINETGGIIEARDGGTVTFTAPAGVENAGLMKADDGTLAFNAAAVANDAGATIEALNAGILQFDVAATFDNAGAVDLSDGSIVIDASLTLDGGGTVTLSDATGNAIISGGTPATFTNVDNTIAGAGTIGDAHLTFINESLGVVDADGHNALDLEYRRQHHHQYGAVRGHRRRHAGHRQRRQQCRRHHCGVGSGFRGRAVRRHRYGRHAQDQRRRRHRDRVRQHHVRQSDHRGGQPDRGQRRHLADAARHHRQCRHHHAGGGRRSEPRHFRRGNARRRRQHHPQRQRHRQQRRDRGLQQRRQHHLGRRHDRRRAPDVHQRERGRGRRRRLRPAHSQYRRQYHWQRRPAGGDARRHARYRERRQQQRRRDRSAGGWLDRQSGGRHHHRRHAGIERRRHHRDAIRHLRARRRHPRRRQRARSQHRQRHRS